MDALRDLFDERIIEIMSLFMENPGRKYFLSDVAKKTNINVTTTFRILNRLVEKGFVKSTVIGKVRRYELERNQKTMQLLKLLKKEDDPLQKFIDAVSQLPRIKKIVLETRERKGAKILIIGDFIQKEKIKKEEEKIKKEHDFEINSVELSEDQYKQLRGFKSYGLDEKTIWKKEDKE